MAEEILGISGHIDISDIQRSIDELVSSLDKIGVRTEALSKRMSDAMNDIASSSADSATKQKQAMEVLSQGMEEAKKALVNYPDILRQAKNEADATALATSRLEAELNKLNTQFSGAVVGSKTYEELKRSIAGVEQQIQSNNRAHEAQLATIQEMESGYNSLVSLYGVANTATAANAVAHSATAVTVGVEAAQHAVNSEKIGEETRAALENKTVKEQQVDIEQRVAQAIEMETSSYDGLLEKMQSGKVSSEEYARVIEGLRERIAALRNESLNVGEKFDTEQAKALTWDNGGETPLGDENKVRALREEYSILSSQIGALEGILSEVESAWNSLHGTAEKAQAEMTNETKRTTEAVREYNAESEKEPSGFRQQWQNVNEMHDKIRELTRELREHEAEYDKLADKPGFDEQSKKAKELQEHISNLKKEIADTKKEMSEETGVGSLLARWTNSVKDALTGNGKFQDSLGNMKTALGGLVAPFTAATTGAMTFVKALWAMAATPIGAVISAIVLGLQALFAWFNKDAEGQRAFAKITAYVGSLLSSITDIAVRIGKYLFHAFADPQGALNQFGRGLIGMVVNPLKAVGNTLAGVGQIAKGVLDLIRSGANVAEAKKAVEGISEGWDSLKKAAGNVVDTVRSVWDAGAGAVSGAYDLIGKGLKTTWETNLTESGTKMFEVARQSAQLAGQELEAQKALSEAKRDEAKLDIEIAKEREKIYTLTGKEKDAQIEKVKQMLKEKYQPQIQAQQKLLEIQQKRNSLHTVSLEQLSKEREAQGAVYALQARAASSTRMLVRMQQANLRSMANANKKDARQQVQIDSAEGAYNEIERKNATARAKFFQDMEQKITDARIAAMKDGSERVIAERKRNLEKELEQLDEQRNAAIESERSRQKAEFEAQEKIIKARGGAPEQWDESKIDKSAIDSINAQFEKLRAFTVSRFQNDEIQQQIQSMREYLKEYGTFQEQKLAIAQEYAEKIAKAEASGNMGEVLKLKAELKRAQGEAKANELARGIDFSQMFDGVGTIVKTIAKETYNRVQDYKATDEYRRSSAESKKAIADLEARLIEKGGAGSASPFSSKTWDDITTAAKRYDDALRNLQEKTDAHTAAVERDRAAQEALTKGFSSSEEQYRAMEEAVAAAAEAQRTANEQKEAQSESEQAGQEVANASNAAAKGLQDFNTILGQIKSGSLGDFANGVSNIIHQLAGKTDKEMTGLVGLIGEKAGGIVGAILSVIDMLGDNPTEVIDGILNGIERVIEEVLTHIPEIIGSILKGVARIVGGIAVGVIPRLFGLDLLGGNDNHEEQLKVQEKLNRTISSTTDALKRMTDELERSYGVLAMQTGDEAKELIRRNMESIMKGIDSVMWDRYGGGSSDYYHANKALNDSRSGLYSAGLFDYLRKYGINAYESSQGENTWQQIFSYDPETLAKMFKEIRDSGDDLWRVITQEMGYNDGALEEWLQKLISTYEQIDDIEETALERITTTTKENVMDGFLDDLYNMANGADDVFENIADNWQQMVNKMVVNNLVANNFKSKLEKWYAELAKANEKRLSSGDNDWYKRELDRLKAEYEEYARDAKSQIEELRGMGIIAATGENAQQQSASVQAMERITVDQADELIGRMNAGQIIWEHQFDKLAANTEILTSLNDVMMRMGGEVGDIARNMGEVIEMHRISNTHLANIDSNTKPIRDMADDLYRIKKLIEERY